MLAAKDIQKAPLRRRMRGALAALAAGRSGNVAPLLAVAIIPLVAAVGLSIDGARGWLVKSRLSQAIDAAGLAGGRVITSTNRDDEIQMFFDANFPPGYMNAVVEGPNISVNADLTTIKINAAATIPTTFMRVVGQRQMRIRAESVIERTDRGMELALVMDNTGSMHRNNKIAAMKAAATELVNNLYGDRETVPTLWVGLVPYAAIVNIGAANIAWTKERSTPSIAVTAASFKSNENSSATGTVCMTTTGHPFWDGAIVDVSGADQPEYNGRHLIRTVQTTALDGNPVECTIAPGEGNKKFWYVIEGREATVAQPSGTIRAQLPPTDYSQAAGTGWKGCVEGRSAPYEEESAELFPATENEKWVRAFWPSTRGMKFFNSYKRRISRYTPPTGAPTSYPTARDGDNDWGADMTPRIADVSADYFAYGPNFGCPTAITPLQQSKTTVLDAIDAMGPWGRSGTMANVGLSWGWRVLSPAWRGKWSGAPAHLPLDYRTPLMSKVVILLTDGENLWNDQPYVPPGCNGISNCSSTGAGSGLASDGDYTAYGRLSERRMGTVSNAQAKTEINNRMLRLCSAMKSQGIIIYTIVLQENDAATQQLYRDCATQPHTAHAYFSPTSDELSGIFKQIATQLANLRLAK